MKDKLNWNLPPKVFRESFDLQEAQIMLLNSLLRTLMVVAP